MANKPSKTNRSSTPDKNERPLLKRRMSIISMVSTNTKITQDDLQEISKNYPLLGICLRHLIRYKNSNPSIVQQNYQIFIELLDECSSLLTALLSYQQQLDFDWILEVVLGAVEILRNLEIKLRGCKKN